MIRSLRNVARLLGIARTLARHDALFPLETLGVAPAVVVAARLLSQRRAEGRGGQRLARALEEAGPSFIKLGQALSTRSDILGEEMAADLSDLQDRLPPFSGEEARAAITAEFGEPVEALFERFEDKAVAAASIAQVHYAVTADGAEVAVKVLRPGIEAAFARDLDLFLWVAELFEAARPEWRRLKPVETVQTLWPIRSSSRWTCASRRRPPASSPRTSPDDATFHGARRSTGRGPGRRVMTTERVLGIPIDDREAIIAAGHDPEAVLGEGGGNAFFNQVFRDGFFHADLHAGQPLRAGRTGRSPPLTSASWGVSTRRPTAHTSPSCSSHFSSRDYRRAADDPFRGRLGTPPTSRSTSFTQACRSIAEPIFDKPQNEISIARLLALSSSRSPRPFEMEAQPQLLLLQKTMLVGEGTGRKLAPEANMWFLARPLVERMGEPRQPRPPTTQHP